MNSSAPIRSCAADEGSVQISLWSIPIIIAVVGVCLFSGLGALGVVGPDEPRYAAIAQAMCRTNDWITPRLWGMPWFEKPVLYYWAAGICMRIFGVSEFAARLPSALAALLATLAIGWTALRSYGLATARYALLLLPTSAALIGFSRAASTDMLFAGFLTVAFAFALGILQKQQPGPLLRGGFGFFLGLAVLAKGPAAILLAGGAILLWATLSRQWLALFRFLNPLLITVFSASALPWYVLCALRNPDFLRVFIWQHNFERYLTPMFEHRQPFWFYIPVLCAATAPWIVILFGVFLRGSIKKKRLSPPGLFIACWAAFPLFFFSLSQSKLPGYILPSIPPLFLLGSRAFDRVMDSRKDLAALLTGITGAFFAVLAISFPTFVIRMGHAYEVPAGTPVALLILSGLGGLIAVSLSVRMKPAAALTTIGLLVAILVLFLNAEILPYADSRISAKAEAMESLPFVGSSRDVSISDVKRDWKYGLDYYYGREIPEWTPGTPLPEWLFTNERNAMELRKLGDRVHVLSRVGAPYAVLIHVSPENGNRP